MKRLALPTDAVKLVAKLARGNFKPPPVTPVELSPLEVALRQYQADRLAERHGDFLHDPMFGAAAKFFLTDVYAAKDFSRRDAELESLYEHLHSLLPKEAVESMANAIALNELTQREDHAMLERLRAVGVTDRFTREEYETAYAQGDYDARVRQIDLVVAVMREVAELHKWPFIGTALHVTRGTARRMGWEDLHDFLVRGYDAWRGVSDPEPFLEAVHRREKATNDSLFGRV